MKGYQIRWTFRRLPSPPPRKPPPYRQRRRQPHRNPVRSHHHLLLYKIISFKTRRYVQNNIQKNTWQLQQGPAVVINSNVTPPVNVSLFTTHVTVSRSAPTAVMKHRNSAVPPPVSFFDNNRQNSRQSSRLQFYLKSVLVVIIIIDNA